MFFDQPADIVDPRARFLATRQHELHGAFRRSARCLQPRHRIGPDRCLCLVVGAAAGIEPAVFLDQCERITRPILALGIDDIEMRQQHHRAERRIAARQGGDQATIQWQAIGNKDIKVGIGKARRFQPRRHALGSQRAIAGGVAGIGFNEFLVKRPERGLVRPIGGHCRHGQHCPGRRRQYQFAHI